MSTNSTNKSAIKLSVIALAMFGFGYLLVPLYDVLCDITGLNGKSENITQAQSVDFITDESRLITVEFITNLNQGLSWDFKPEVTKLQVHPGKAYQTIQTVSLQDRPYPVLRLLPQPIIL